MAPKDNAPAAALPDEAGTLADALGFHLRLAHGAAYRHFGETFAELALTQQQAALLWLVGDHPGVAQTGISARMRMDRATTMAIVNKLQARGLIERRPFPADGRMQALVLTDAGREALCHARRANEAHEAWLRARFTPREADLLVRLLARIYE